MAPICSRGTFGFGLGLHHVKQLAEALGFQFLDTGAMYRAITLGVIRKQIDFSDTAQLISYAQTATIEWQGTKLLLDKDDVTQEIRSPIVTDSIKFVADIAEIRRRQRWAPTELPVRWT